MTLVVVLILQSVFLLAVYGQRVRPWTQRDCQRVRMTPPINHPPPPIASIPSCLPTVSFLTPVGQTAQLLIVTQHAYRHTSCLGLLSIVFNSKNVSSFSHALHYWGKVHSMQFRSNSIQLVLEVLISQSN